MKNRPLILKGNINIKNTDEYIIGKIIKNKNIENKETYIQVLNSENIDLYEKGYKGIFRSCEGNSSICGTEYLAGKLQSKFIRMYYEERSQESVI